MDAMVTGRMSQAKKEAGNAVFMRLGLSTSAAINQMYDFAIREGHLPFFDVTSPDKETIREKIALVDSISLPADNRFSAMSDSEIKRERLGV